MLRLRALAYVTYGHKRELVAWPLSVAQASDSAFWGWPVCTKCPRGRVSGVAPFLFYWWLLIWALLNQSNTTVKHLSVELAFNECYNC